MPKEFLTERNMEQAFIRRVNALGCVTHKFTSPAKRGVEDRINILPTGDIHLVELKTIQGKLSPLQKKNITTHRAQGAVSLCLWGRRDLEAYLAQVEEHIAAVPVARLPVEGERFYQRSPELRFMA